MTSDPAHEAVRAYLRWYVGRNPKATAPMPGICDGHSFMFDAGGAPFTKAGEVMVDLQPDWKFKYADLWKEAKQPRGQLTFDFGRGVTA